MKNQLLKRQAMHVAQLLPEDTAEAMIVLGYVQEIYDWTDEKLPANVVQFIPGRRKWDARIASAGIFLAFLIGWCLDPPFSVAAARHIETPTPWFLPMTTGPDFWAPEKPSGALPAAVPSVAPTL